MVASHQNLPSMANNNALEAAESKLQQELREMFAVDSQQQLQAYLDLVANLQPQSWTADIQSLYRAIHTIKGSAVTVGAEATLCLATTLEDLLSDLRYLDSAPPLADRHLQEILLEGGELLATTLSLANAKGMVARTAVEPCQQQLLALREQVQANYLLDWDEQKQLHQDFAEQGLDLVTLDLEMALEQLPVAGPVPTGDRQLAEQLLAQLAEMGQDLELADGWSELLSQARTLLDRLECAVWKLQWPAVLAALKASLKAGGTFVPVEAAIAPDAAARTPLSPPAAARTDGSILDVAIDAIDSVDSDLSLTDMDAASFLDAFDAFDADPAGADNTLELADLVPHAEFPEARAALSFAADGDAATDGELPQQPAAIEPPAPNLVERSAIAATAANQPTPETAPETAQDRGDARIPVPLERLERSAQTSISTVLSLRAVRGTYQALQSRLAQLVSISRASSRYTTQLRDLQNDYASIDRLETLTLEPDQETVLERYRQGYTTINRLLEMNLRLSELGAEAEKISQQTANSLQNLDRDVLQLQATIEASRLVPFQDLVFRARATLRDLRVRVGKPVQLQIAGERTELDVGVVRQLESVLLHLLRNAYDHGLEPPAERQAAGKPPQGRICMSLQRQGSRYLLDISDDGRGVDADAVRNRAIALDLPLQDVETAADLLAVLSQPGFSSRAEVTDISGRGVGMDIVASGIARLGGSLNLQTTPGRGTTFTLAIPVPRLLVPCVLFQAGDLTFAIPTEEIETTLLFEHLAAEPFAVEGYGGIWEVTDAVGKTTPALDLQAYWQPERSPRSLEDTAICAYIRPPQSPKGIWLFADELLGQADLPIEALPSPLVAPSGLLGTSLQGDGSLVPVLETASLARFLTQAVVARVAVPNGFAAPDTREIDDRILIVDDAALMRRRLEASLSACGYATHTCADGLEAWSWLQMNPRPSLVITDIEMPAMDGFTLIDRCRQAGLSAPILVVSSRLSEEWHREACRLGAADYLTKGFSTAELLEKVSSLVGNFGKCSLVS